VGAGALRHKRPHIETLDSTPDGIADVFVTALDGADEHLPHPTNGRGDVRASPMR
jgi:hypothetical protein